ncbi:hypothetical protein EJ04DRAFT_271218 [Polyplosphaeria fusca]|uniref:Uncharacterized protein n=1 Tax=Polyplosphaeria fusca TaxID=682080 RepID=A0A9P4QVN0_9PLEO|nr:hypothetical protein EJ04DRAFT_271218 [Polyplosphaeria fusca]
MCAQPCQPRRHSQWSAIFNRSAGCACCARCTSSSYHLGIHLAAAAAESRSTHHPSRQVAWHFFHHIDDDAHSPWVWSGCSRRPITRPSSLAASGTLHILTPSHLTPPTVTALDPSQLPSTSGHVGNTSQRSRPRERTFRAAAGALLGPSPTRSCTPAVPSVSLHSRLRRFSSHPTGSSPLVHPVQKAPLTVRARFSSCVASFVVAGQNVGLDSRSSLSPIWPILADLP